MQDEIDGRFRVGVVDGWLDDVCRERRRREDAEGVAVCGGEDGPRHVDGVRELHLLERGELHACREFVGDVEEGRMGRGREVAGEEEGKGILCISMVELGLLREQGPACEFGGAGGALRA